MKLLKTYDSVIMLSDIHAESNPPVGRRDNIFETFKRKFDKLLTYALKHNALIIQAGDLTNKPRDWRILDYLTSMLCVLKIHGLDFISLPGQHDLYMRNFESPSTFRALVESGLVFNLQGAENILGYKFRYFKSKKVNLVLGALLYDEVNIKNVLSKLALSLDHFENDIGDIFLVFHGPVGINRQERCRYEVGKFIALINKIFSWRISHNIAYILFGDIHEAFDITNQGRIALNTGPMLRLRRVPAELNHKPHFYLHTVNHPLERISLPYEPDIFYEGLDENIESENVGNEVLREFARAVEEGHGAGGALTFESITNAIINDMSKAARNKLKELFAEYDIVHKGR